jgi:hypothetical protein
MTCAVVSVASISSLLSVTEDLRVLSLESLSLEALQLRDVALVSDQLFDGD